jgi:polyribonucleotide nucleotidyltransferase
LRHPGADRRSAAWLRRALFDFRPIGALRVGYKNGQYLLNLTAASWPLRAELVVAGTERGADGRVRSQGASEDVMLGAVMFGHRETQKVINASTNWSSKPAPSRGLAAPAKNDAMMARSRKRWRQRWKPSGPRQAAAPDAISAIKKTCDLAGRAPKDGWSR